MNTLPILAKKKQVRVASVWRLLPMNPHADPDDLPPVKRMDFDIEVEDDALQGETADRIRKVLPVLKDSLAQNHHFVKYCGFWVDLFEYDFLVHIIGKTTLEPANKTIRKGYCSVYGGILIENDDLLAKLALFKMGLISKQQLILDHADFVVLYCHLQQMKKQSDFQAA